MLKQRCTGIYLRALRSHWKYDKKKKSQTRATPGNVKKLTQLQGRSLLQRFY